MNITFTIQEFHQQLIEFRQLFGNKEFMTGPEEKRELAVKGFAFCYMNTKTTSPEEEAHIQGIFKATMDEYTRRQTMLIMLPLKDI